MTRTFLGFCLIVFALCLVSDHSFPIWDTQFKLSTTLRFGGMWGPLNREQPWRYLSAVFAHANLLHVGMNCFVLASVGARVERELGKARFVILFVLSGIFGFLASDAWYAFMGPPTVGASGAVFGLFGAAIGAAYARRDPTWKQILFQNLIWLLVLSFAGSGAGGGVNNAAHVGGLVTGALLGFVFTKETRRLKLDLPFALIAVLLCLLSVASVGLSVASPVWRIVQAQEMSRQF